MAQQFTQRIPPCRCEVRAPFKIAMTHEDSPCICLACDGTVALNELEISEDYRRELVAWRREYEAVHALWREAGVYAAWARTELHDLKSPINESGRILASGMPPAYMAYYAAARGDGASPSRCERCNSRLSPPSGYEAAGLACDACRILYPLTD